VCKIEASFPERDNEEILQAIRELMDASVYAINEAE